jgi:hypothetical protein
MSTLVGRATHWVTFFMCPEAAFRHGAKAILIYTLGANRLRGAIWIYGR